jgi:hypothetical protein
MPKATVANNPVGASVYRLAGRVGRDVKRTPENPSHAPSRTHINGESKCPTCDGTVPAVPLGRPRTYCTPGCRREMARLREDLASGEAQLAGLARGSWITSVACAATTGCARSPGSSGRSRPPENGSRDDRHRHRRHRQGDGRNRLYR